MNNYRLISKLPCLAKILERLISNQKRSYLSDYDILNVFQSGFRPGHSTVSAASKVVSDIVHALDNKQDCVVLFIDLSKAFDTVGHAILLEHLNNIGFDIVSCRWVEKYLSDRSQAVVADGYQSYFLNICKGVPKGSV